MYIYPEVIDLLRRLYIKDLALIEGADVELSPGLNIITGETGAGKSMLIGALGLILGERADTDSVRKGAERCMVEGTFELSEGHPILQKLDDIGVSASDEDTYLFILRREVSSDGKSRCFANGSSITSRTLRQIGDLLVDLHGQHDHQSLLKVDEHVEFLDGFGRLTGLVQKVEKAHRELGDAKKSISELEWQKERLEEKRELEAFQLNEILEADPKIGEDDDLERGRSVLENSQFLSETGSGLLDMLYEGEDSVVDRLGRGERQMSDAARIDNELSSKLSQFQELIYRVEDLADFFRDYVQKIQSDPGRLEEVGERLVLLERLKRKYGQTLDNVIKYMETLERELGLSDAIDEQIGEARSLFVKIEEKFSKLCAELSRKRDLSGRKLSLKVNDALGDLGMERAKFRVDLMRTEVGEGGAVIDGRRFEAGPKGAERTEFYISTNPGEGEKPLKRIASGGEVSRIMLALKSILADVDSVPLLVFDEIDIGISGRIADAVGKKLRQLSASHQVISITHLPQIASYAEEHLCVIKEVKGRRSITSVVTLDEDQRKEELAKLIAGEDISDVTKRYAEELLSRG